MSQSDLPPEINCFADAFQLSTEQKFALARQRCELDKITMETLNPVALENIKTTLAEAYRLNMLQKNMTNYFMRKNA